MLSRMLQDDSLFYATWIYLPDDDIHIIYHIGSNLGSNAYFVVGSYNGVK